MATYMCAFYPFERCEPMFYPLSKLLGWFTQPLVIAILLLAAACLLPVTGRRKAAQRAALLSLLVLVIGGLSPLSSALILPLENRFVRPALGPDARIDGIIVLGGAESTYITFARGTPTMNEASERFIEGMALARRFPNARIVFSGGSGALAEGDESNTETATMFFREQGLDMRRLTLEGRSRNTHENAVFTKSLVRPAPGERWLLVTSAFHMPRSIGCFRRVGWDVLAWPADYRTAGREDLTLLFDNPTEGFRRLDPAVKEWIGLVVYRLTGRILELFPAPAP